MKLVVSDLDGTLLNDDSEVSNETIEMIGRQELPYFLLIVCFIGPIAEELIYQKGYVATSISDIMEAADVGKGQLYYYFKSKKEIGLTVIQDILANWRKELFEEIFEADKSDSDKFSDMIDWVCQFHESQTVFYGCPIGNLIVELSTEDENFRCPLNDFMTQWTEKLASLLQDLHADWSEERAQLQARQVISSIQGSIVILKVSQDIQVLENNMTDLKKNYC